MEWTTIITAVVAVYGAALSTYTMIQDRKEKRRQIRMKPSNGMLTFGPELSPAMLLIEATNPGNRTVILDTAGIFLHLTGVMSRFSPAGNFPVPARRAGAHWERPC